MDKNKAGDWEIRLEIGQTGTEQGARAMEVMCLLEKPGREQRNGFSWRNLSWPRCVIPWSVQEPSSMVGY